MRYRNLLFDLGGVIMDIRRLRCVEALKELGMGNAGDFLGDYVQSGAFLQLENGEITSAEFRDEIRKNIEGRDVTDAEIDEAFCKFLIGIPRHRLVALRELGQRYNVYMLSNTNEIMYNSTIRECFEQEGLTMQDYFKGCVTSFQARASKPSAAIFEYTINKLGIKPEETLFFDDSQKNLDAAAAFGFHTCLVPPGSEFDVLFKKMEEA